MRKYLTLIFVICFSCFLFVQPIATEAPVPLFRPDDNIQAASQEDALSEAEAPSEGLYLPAPSRTLIYYTQHDPRWAEKNYGPQNKISSYGCGPTVLSMLVSGLTDSIVTPDTMAEWCYENGFFSQNSGSYHSIIPEGAQGWGLSAKSLTDLSYKSILDELYAGNIIVMLMGSGHFTSSGHFIIIRNVTLEGQLLIADPASPENSQTAWDCDTIVSEIKRSYDAGGPVWSIGVAAGDDFDQL